MQPHRHHLDRAEGLVMTDTITTLTGGCRCGLVRYEAGTAGLKSVVCACSDCQRSSGSFLSVAVGIKTELFHITAGQDALKSYADTGESGQPVHRSFCGECGSQMFARPDSYAHIVSLRAMTLDEPFKGPPAFGIFQENIPEWIQLPDVTFYTE
jgi:hypothetical protein